MFVFIGGLFIIIAIVIFFVRSRRRKWTGEYPFVPPDIVNYDELLRNNPEWQEKLIKEHAQFEIYINCLEEKKNEWAAIELSVLDKAPVIADLIISKPINEIYYSDLLSCVEWKYKRLNILVRDQARCVDCGEHGMSKEVHHQYYLYNKLPWDIDDGALVSLCRRCHIKRHQKEKIKCFRIVNGSKVEVENVTILCYKCSGAGWFPEYKHVASGVCFRCNGNRVERTLFSDELTKHNHTYSTEEEKQLRMNYRDFLSSISLSQYKSMFPPIFLPKVTNHIDDLPF